MLFDLRSRGRRRTVQTVYLGLAILMGGGLVLFGVGAGNGFGGILNAFTGGGSSGAQTQVVSQQEKTALRQAKLTPNDPAAWAALVQARWTNATTNVSNYDPNSQIFSASGKKELAALVQAWQKYLALSHSPDPNVAILAARAYAKLGSYADAATAWETVTLSNPTAVSGFECLAATAYAAGESRKGDLATAKAVSLVPQLQRATVKQELRAAKSSPQIAQGC
ncbi:MAG: tetratricopeptide repeat protein [Solirubrobacteraceae bacterium]